MCIVCTPTIFPATPAAAADIEGRVTRGSVVTAADVSVGGRWSSTVAVIANEGTSARLCTGTLIAPNWVATAAHCVARYNAATQSLPAANIVVAPGITSISQAGNAVIDVVSAHIHSGFNWDTASWDAALLELASVPRATPVSLPDPLRADTYAQGYADNVAGFGRSQAAVTGSDGTLRSGRLEQADAEACEAANPGSSAYADCFVPGPGGQATCHGDSGGPLLRWDATQGMQPVLWGITSTGPDPCDYGALGDNFAPGYQTRVTSISAWIHAVMARSSYVPSGRTTQSSLPRGEGDPETGTGTRASGIVNKTRTPAGGVGIGVYGAKLSRKVSKKRGARLAVTASLVGTTGLARAELQSCTGKKCRTLSRKNLSFDRPGVIAKATLKVPRCPLATQSKRGKQRGKKRGKAKRTTYNLRLTAVGTDGQTVDRLSQRVATCR